MSTALGIIGTIDDEIVFYEIKAFLEKKSGFKLVYITRDPHNRLYIKRENELLRDGMEK